MAESITLITGTSKGIGRFLAEYYVNKGHLVIGCSRSEVKIGLNNYHHFRTDVADEDKVKQMFSEIRRKFGKLDHLVNNAGIASMNHVLLTPMSMVHNILSTNVAGTFLFCREAAKLMKRQGRGRIVNFTTIAVPLNLAGEAIYVASKAAVMSLTKVLAKELAEYGLTVNAIGPTPVQTDLVRSVPKNKIDSLIDQQAIPRMGTFEDIVNVIDFYLKEESEFITGQVLYLGGI